MRCLERPVAAHRRDDLWEILEQRRDTDRAEAWQRLPVGVGHRHTDLLHDMHAPDFGPTLPVTCAARWRAVAIGRGIIVVARVE